MESSLKLNNFTSSETQEMNAKEPFQAIGRVRRAQIFENYYANAKKQLCVTLIVMDFNCRNSIAI